MTKKSRNLKQKLVSNLYYFKTNIKLNANIFNIDAINNVLLQ